MLAYGLGKEIRNRSHWLLITKKLMLHGLRQHSHKHLYISICIAIDIYICRLVAVGSIELSPEIHDTIISSKSVSGLLITYVALNLMDGHGQPALLYIVPFTLGNLSHYSFVLRSLHRIFVKNSKTVTGLAKMTLIYKNNMYHILIDCRDVSSIREEERRLNGSVE